ncbi:apolipoprotein N-acyltransferase [Arcanobacterium phocisimile]|uniref:Apolipoprotein N-acyltransferase n=1 Tax=Arcanobacterium phocisimile TaxID=1302235 RepID=A0ABX7IIZ1_9ACTO|nr:apolipoprotein N-acyltransferase [Arcanobacterium phocisimile]QRV02956.1 apolipoprotein N-acyltransferase [Arcanobacterium phocisimile]
MSFLWFSVYRMPVMRAMGLGGLWGLAFFIPHTAWAATAAGSVLALVGLALSQASFIAVLAAMWSQISYLTPTWAWLWASISWVGIEHLRASIPFGGMPWGKIAFALNDSPLVRLAPIGSTLLVGLFAVAVSILLAQALFYLPRKFFTAMSSVAFACALAIFPLILPLGGKPTGQFAIGVVQGGSPTKTAIPDGWKRALQVTSNHVEQARQITHADLIVLPESTSDRDVRTDEESGNLLRSLVGEVNTPIMFGTQEYTDEGRYNDYLVMGIDGKIIGRYSKQHPVPFGEYIPFREALSDVSASIAEVISQVTVDMFPGTGPAQLIVPTGRGEVAVATPICFEVAYDRLISDGVIGVERPSGLIVVPTNNASFGDSGEPYQQFAMTRFRAMEHGRSAVQVSTTGVSGVVEANGVVRYQTSVGEQDSATVSVPLYTHVTFATRTAHIREYLGYACAAIGVIVSIYAYRRRSQSKRRR